MGHPGHLIFPFPLYWCIFQDQHFTAVLVKMSLITTYVYFTYNVYVQHYGSSAWNKLLLGSAALKAITLSTCKPACKAKHFGNEKSACNAKPFWLGLICLPTLSSTQLQCGYLNVHTKINKCSLQCIQPCKLIA